LAKGIWKSQSRSVLNLIYFYIQTNTADKNTVHYFFFTAARCCVWFYSLILKCWHLFHFQGFSVRETNFVHWLSSFCYPDRTTGTLLDQMDHPFGYTLRPGNKTMYNWST